jgi:uncharacterized protein YdiU (UPF0061 family)
MSVVMSSIAPRFDNSFLRDLRPEPKEQPPHQSRQVFGAHYTLVRPSVPTPKPTLVCWSEEVAASLGLSAEDLASDDFARIFGGRIPDDWESWATAYGASFAGSYGGQRGDGRAISIGQWKGQEVQLKGAGTTPYSRQFDGRAVLRSCVREFLASEAMAALRVPTTRALSVVTSGDMVQRYWYNDDGVEMPRSEPGAVGCRTSPSFLRLGQFELYHQNGEKELLRELGEHALHREFAHLLVQHPGESKAELVVRMFDEICTRQAHLVSEWLRVGYCQGNMNSDNSAIGGVTLDYGPFAFMEKFAPMFNPWVGGGMPYAFGRQPQAAAINLSGVAPAFVEIVQMLAKVEGLSKQATSSAIEGVRRAVSHTFVDSFHAKLNEDCRQKLGLATWDDEAQLLWDDLFRLMSSQCGTGGIDFTIFFRGLTEGGEGGEGGKEDPLAIVRGAALEDPAKWPSEHQDAWIDWTARFNTRIAAEARPHAERTAEMSAANPKYILRNWMAAEAHEAATRGDFTIVRELHEVLRRPYEDQGDAVNDRWYQRTPVWARDRAGLAFMS